MTELSTGDRVRVTNPDAVDYDEVGVIKQVYMRGDINRVTYLVGLPFGEDVLFGASEIALVSTSSGTTESNHTTTENNQDSLGSGLDNPL